MTSPVEETPTELDPGRRRVGADDADVTALDPGRTRPVSDGGPTQDVGLPPGLHSRFTIRRVLRRSAHGTFVYHVRDRASDNDQVLKVYRGPAPDRYVWTVLRRRQSRHLVHVTETGTVDGADYEIMEYLAGDSLTDLRDGGTTSGLGDETLRHIVRQVTLALTELHASGIVHRDVKPSNLRVRMIEPFEVALFDFDISQHVPSGTTFATDRSGTVRYMPPEFIGGSLVSPRYDWWSLGVTVFELATGQRLLEGLDDDNALRQHITGGPLNVSAVVDPRVRLLCRGLLAQSTAERWGADQVNAWLRGESPDVPTGSAPNADGPDTVDPFGYLGREFRDRELLASSMTATWGAAATLLFGRDPEPLRRLEKWLRQFPEPVGDDHRGTGREPGDVRLVRLLRAMAPAHPPIYRETNITWRLLPDLAQQAMRGEGTTREIVRELWEHNLLPLLASGAEAPGLGSGDGLGRVRTRWSDEQSRWRAAAATVLDPGARAWLVGAGGDDAAHRRADDLMLALCLWGATASDEARDAVRRDLGDAERAFRLAWFTDLVRQPDGLWLAYRLRPYAQERAAERDTAERAAARRRAWLRRTETFREWSRRQNRPLALSWAVAGVFAMAVLCTLLIGVSDIADNASDAVILDAWLATVLASAVALTFEAVLAWETGGRFHPRYSILGAAMIALGRAARSIAGRGLALVAVAGCLGAGYALTVLAPVVTPLVAGGGVVVWAVARFLRWRTHSEHERAEMERDRLERLNPAR